MFVAGSAVSIGLAEQLAYKMEPENSVYWQIQGASEGATYSLSIVNPATRQEVALVEEFEEGVLKGMLEKRWTASLPEGVYGYVLYRDDKAVLQSPEKMGLLDERMEVAFAKVSRRNNVVNWSVGQPAISRVSVGTSSGMFVRRLTDWKYTAGNSALTPWDFWDEQNVANYRGHAALNVFVQYFPLEKGWLVVGTPQFEKNDELLAESMGQAIPSDEIDFSVEFLIEKPNEQVVIISSGDALRVTLSKDSERILERRRFEILVYLDGEFIHEESQGVTPYTYLIPEIDWADGEHVLTVNILDYEGNFSSRSKRVVFR